MLISFGFMIMENLSCASGREPFLGQQEQNQMYLAQKTCT